jgi:hypothetical protein
VKQSLDDGTSIIETVAGNGSCGTAFDMICTPTTIFVNINFDLYVADCKNDRVQLFEFKQIIGTTVPKGIETSSIKLNCPTAIFLNADKYLFIVDGGNSRIIGSNTDGLYCLVGCSDESGAASYQLNFPSAAAFDHYGNIFVADMNNNRIQKFMLVANASGK